MRSVELAPPGVLPDLAEPLPAVEGRRIFDDFLARTAETPDAVAVSFGEMRLTYAQVEARSRSLAQHLVRKGVAPGDRVAILAERGPAFVWSMLAAARAGATFVVLDSAYPEPRLNELMAIAAPRAVIRAGGADLQGLAERLASERRCRVLDADAEPDAAADAERLDRARPSDTAYILFTSGSTGRPKGVAVSHDPLAHFVRWQAQEFGLTREDRVSLLSGLSHDPVMRDVFTPLALGARVCIPPAEAMGAPGGLARWLAADEITVTHLTPQMGRLILTGAAAELPRLRHVFWGGDRLRRDVVVDMATIAPAVRQTNFYGATETPQAVAAASVDPGLTSDHAPIGRGIAGAQLLVVDAQRHLLGVGEPGEIAVRSSRLSLGYLQDGRITPTIDQDVYYTGDRGLYLPDGSIMLVGRQDDQLKIRGHRVEPAEIARLLQDRPGVRDAIVIPVGDEEPSLVAFVSGPRDLARREADLAESLAARLPAHMVPQRVVWIEAMPLGPNGKVRREALLEYLAARDATPSVAEPAGSDTERRLIEAWTSLLGGRAVAPSSTFASLGGDSLSYVQAYLATEEVIGDPPAGWQLMTIADLAATVKSAEVAPREMDSAILLRAAAIVLVVGAHYGLVNYGGGATGALMLISGFLFGGMGLSEVFRTRSAIPAFTILRNIVIPAAVMGLVIWLFRLPGSPPPSYLLLMTADLQDWRTANPQDLPLWYVHALVHILAFVALAVGALQLLRRLDIGRDAFLWGLFVLGCAGRFLFPAVLDSNFWRIGVRHLDMIHFLPTSHLATFALGGLVACADTPVRRRRLFAVILAYALASGPFYGPGQAAFVFLSGTLLTFAPRLAIPRPLAVGVFAVAGASLWIYLTHILWRDGLGQLGVTLPPGVDLVSALLVGVGVARGWSFAAAAFRRLRGRDPAMSSADATI